MVKIALDAGHGINTSGKRTPDGEREWSFNNKVLRATSDALSKYKDVSILRLDDATGKSDVSLQARTNAANRWGADALVSIHHNASTGKWGSWGGVETYVHPTARRSSYDLAAEINPRIVQAMGLRDRGVKQLNLHMVRESNMSAILTEGGFMDSTTDIGALRSDARLKAQGIAIAEGLVKYYKLTLKTGASKPASKPTPAPTAPKPTTPKPTAPKASGTLGLVDWLKANKHDSSYGNRATLAAQYGIKGYSGTAAQNLQLLAHMQGGKLAVKPAPKATPPQKQTSTYSKGQKVTIKNSAGKYSRSSASIPTMHKNKSYTIQQVGADDVLIKELYSWVKKSDLAGGTTSSTTPSTTTPASTTPRVGQTVTLSNNAVTFATGQSIANHAKGKRYKVLQVKSDRVLLDKIMSWVRRSDVN